MPALTLNQVNSSVIHTLRLPTALDIRFKNNQTGKNISRKKVVDASGLSALKHKIGPRSRVAHLNWEISKICGAQVGADVEIYLAGKRVDGRLMLNKLM